MGSSQRMAAVAAASHAKHYYNHTQPSVAQSDTSNYSINIFFVSATLCGVLVAVCAACWRRSPGADKPEDAVCAGVYTVSDDAVLTQVHEMDMPGPPPAYETVVDLDLDGPSHLKDCVILQEGEASEECPRCLPPKGDVDLPSYEAAVMLRDTKL